MKWVMALTMSGLCVACGGTGTADKPASETPTASTAPAVGTGTAAPTTVVPPPVVKERAEPVRPPVPQFHDVIVPAGTALRLDLKSAIGTDSSQVEDAVQASLRQPVVVEGTTILPAGTDVTGAVTDVERAGKVKGRAHLAYRFTSLRHGGERYDIATAPISHEAKASKGDDAKKIAIGAGAGAALGAIFGGGDGAAKGAAIGGAGGTGVVLATRGKEVRLGPGANVTARLTAPLTIRVKTADLIKK